MEAVAKKYIRALVDGADSATKKDYYEVLEGFAKAYEQDDVALALNSPLIPSEKKIELMDAFTDRTDKHMAGFLKLIAQNGRFDAMPAMADMLRLQLQKESNSFEGVIKANTQMDQAQIEALASALKEKTGTDITLRQISSDYDGVHVAIADLGIEVGYSKQRITDKLIDYIVKSF
ncbi:MAG: F0F1 ATP synthase subunit delta [Campylobacterota bacterium]